MQYNNDKCCVYLNQTRCLILHSSFTILVLQTCSFMFFFSHDSVTDSCPLILLYIVHSPIKYLAYTTKRMHHAQVTLIDAFF